MATPKLYGSSRLFWYQLVTGILNGASIVVLTYFLYMRAKAGSTAVWHFFAAFERCLPAWWKQRRLEAERESVAQLVTSAIALSYVLQSLTLITGPAPFPSETACAIVGGLINYTGLLNIGFSGFLAPYMAHKLVVKHKHPENVAKILGSRITLISTISFVITVIIALATEWQPIGQAYGRAGCWCWTVWKSNQCDGCTRKFFTKSFLGDDACVLARSSGEELASRRHRAGIAYTAWRTTR